MDDSNNIELLVSSRDEYVINQVKAVLGDNNLPYIEKDHGSGGYMKILGLRSFSETDILVSKEDFHRAEELIDFLLIGE